MLSYLDVRKAKGLPCGWGRVVCGAGRVGGNTEKKGQCVCLQVRESWLFWGLGKRTNTPLKAITLG